MPLTLLWKRRCAVYQLTSAAATQISHKLVYGADELYFFKGASLGFMVLDFRERSEGGADIFLDHSGSTYIIPKLSLYSTGLMPPKVILIRSSLYQ